MRMQLSLVRYVCLVCLLCVGCGGGTDLSGVHGTVTMDDKPLPNALVRFLPVGGGREAAGRTDSNGKFELMFSRGNEGAVPGDYTVSISTASEMTDENDKVVVTEETVPVQYNFNTELKATVKDSGSNEFNFDLKSEGEIRRPEGMAEEGGAY